MQEFKWKEVSPPFGLDVVLKEVRKSKPKRVPKVSNVLQSPIVHTRPSQQSPETTVESTVARAAVVSEPPPAKPLPNDQNLETLENLESIRDLQLPSGTSRPHKQTNNDLVTTRKSWNCEFVRE